MSRKFTRKRPPRWANEVVVEVLSDPRNWKLTTGGDKKNFLSLWIALPGTMNDWTHMEAVAFEERAEKLYEQLEAEGQERFIIRGRILGRRDGWNPRILIRSIEPSREVGTGEITFEELADYGEERESLLSQTDREKVRNRRLEAAARMYHEAAKWAIHEGGFLELREEEEDADENRCSPGPGEAQPAGDRRAQEPSGVSAGGRGGGGDSRQARADDTHGGR